MANPINVVVLPGFAGTTLSYLGGAFGGRTNYWYNPTALASTNPLAGALDADGVSPYPVFGKKLLPGGPVDMGIYEPLLTNLANNGFNPVFWGYDWRMNPNTTAANFANFLKRANLANPFSIVAHSFGGLIAQVAYPLYKALNATPVWNQSIYLGTPHGGSHWSAAALGGWFPHGSELALFVEVFKLKDLPLGFAIEKFYKGIQIALGILVGSWPGLYSLLPNDYGPWEADDPNSDLLSELTEYVNTPGGQQQQWFHAAVLFQQQIVTGLSAPRPLETCIVGSGIPTLTTYLGAQNPGAEGGYQTSLNGDGTVTTHRASLPNIGIIAQLDGVAHNQLVTGIDGNNLVVLYLQNPPSASSERNATPPSTLATPPSALPPLLPPLLNPFANTHSDP